MNFGISIEKNKFKRYIMCEGMSDLAFISLYLEEKMRYKFDKNKTDNNGLDGGKTHIYYYSNDNSELVICSAGGCEKMKDVFEKYLEPLIMRSRNEECPKFVIIKDSDKNGAAGKTAEINYGFLKFCSDKWTSNTFKNAFSEKIECQTFLRIVPLGEDGAFEDLLLKFFKEKEPEITDSVNAYFSDMSDDVKKYILKRRLEIKSKLNCVLNLIDPESTFKTMSDAFRRIDIDNENIKKNYSFLCEL